VSKAREAQREMRRLLTEALVSLGPTPERFARCAECVRLAAVDGDDEIAHGMEDELRAAALEAILGWDGIDARGIAAAALATEALEFSRWCA
jgi:hypothetical protein